VKKIIAWVDREEKKTLISANKNNRIIYFARNKEDFINYLDSDSFPVFSIKKAQKINSIRNMVRLFPNIKFYPLARLDDCCTTPNELSILLDEPNIANNDRSRSQYVASEIMALFEGERNDNANLLGD